MKTQSMPLAAYDVLAEEYYDPIAHPTCHNLNHLSRIFLKKMLPENLCHKSIIEMGTGASAIAELLQERYGNLTNLELHDESEKMLEHSKRWVELGAKAVISSASSILATDSTISLIAASLGDPYNEPSFWAEAARVLEPGGTVLFTMPSYEWARRYRTPETGAIFHSAEFSLRDGRLVSVPSFIYPLWEQVKLLGNAGFMLTRFESLGIEAIGNSENISPKLDVFEGHTSSLLWGFKAIRDDSLL